MLNTEHSTYCGNYAQAVSELKSVFFRSVAVSHACQDKACILSVILEINLNGSRKCLNYPIKAQAINAEHSLDSEVFYLGSVY